MRKRRFLPDGRSLVNGGYDSIECANGGRETVGTSEVGDASGEKDTNMDGAGVTSDSDGGGV